MKTRKQYIAFTIIIIAPLLLGWFLTPLLVKNKIAAYSFLFISTLIPLLYFLTKFIFKAENKAIKNTSYVMVFLFVAMPFSRAYYHLGYENYYLTFTIPFFLNASIVYYNVAHEKFLSINELNAFVLKNIPWLAIFKGSLLLFQTLTNSTIPPFKDLSIERKSFLVFRIIYFFVLVAVMYSVRNKSKKQTVNVLLELLTLIIFFLIYIFASSYLFVNSNFLNGDYYSFVIQILTYLGLTTLGVYTIILIERRDDYSKKIQKVYFGFAIIYCLMVIIPIVLDIVQKYLPSFSKLLLIKGDTFIALVISSVFGSVISSIILQIGVKKDKKNAAPE